MNTGSWTPVYEQHSQRWREAGRAFRLRVVSAISRSFQNSFARCINRVSSRGTLLCVVEGKHDIEFLRRISRILHADDPGLPDLIEYEASGRLRFIPAGGDDLRGWPERLFGLGSGQHHLYDREVPPATALRQATVDRINALPGCIACLTGKRALENYLHPAAIADATGIVLDVDDECDVPGLWGEAWWQATRGSVPAANLSQRQRRRLRNRIKQRLNIAAVECMTPARLRERDPHGDICHWLRTIAESAPPACC